jgi:transcriptional regulator with XRE-family HTH domain
VRESAESRSSQELERGQGNPTLRTLFMLARKLNVRVAEFIGE